MAPAFPETRATLVVALSSRSAEDRARALDLIARVYREPMIMLLRHRWNLDRDAAEDVVQEFFARAVEKEWFSRFDPSRGRFRAFLRTCLEDFARAQHRDSQRLKRGGGVATVPLNTESSELASDQDIERIFDQEWARAVLTLAAQELRRECITAGKEIAWIIYERYDLTDAKDCDRPTYAQLAAELRQPTSQVTNHLTWARRKMRAHVLATIRSLTSDDAEYRAETALLLGDGVA